MALPWRSFPTVILYSYVPSERFTCFFLGIKNTCPFMIFAKRVCKSRDKWYNTIVYIVSWACPWCGPLVLLAQGRRLFSCWNLSQYVISCWAGKIIFQRAADTSGRRLFVLHSSTERRWVLPNPTRKGVNAVYEKILRIMLFTALFASIFVTYAKWPPKPLKLSGHLTK